MKTKFTFLLIAIFLYVGSMIAQTEKSVKQTEKIVVAGKVSTMNVTSVDSKLLKHEMTTDMNMPSTIESSNQINTKNQTNSNVIHDEKNGKKLNLKKSQPAIKRDKKDLIGLQKE